MLDGQIKADLLKRYQTLRDHGDLLSRAQLESAYATFRSRFGPEVLAQQDGETLLNTMHLHGNQESLVYWLEFKNDDEFPNHFGSIAGGSALKFGLYFKKETGVWMTGSATDQRELSLEEAIVMARSHRDQLLRGVKVLERMPEGADDATYQALQTDLDHEAPDVSRLSWGHKYFHLLFPNRLDDFHTPHYQRFHLIRLLQVPPPGDGRYVCGGRYVAIAGELGVPMNHLTAAINDRDGNPYHYWRIGTRLSETKSIWNMMRDDGCIAIGWSYLGDLSQVPGTKEGKEQIQEGLRAEYGHAPGVLGKMTQQVFNFVHGIEDGDVVLAADGKSILGIGRVSGRYKYAPSHDAPHRRPVDWLQLDSWALPVTEGLQTTVYPIRKDPQNLVSIEERLLRPSSSPPPIRALGSVPARVQSILDRKRQVILYGPPGTGKTYWARLSSLEIAARKVFGQPLDALDLSSRAALEDGEGALPPAVRMCTFHPAYGYEDFIEGYRPAVDAAGGHLAFETRDGIFKRLCDDARGQPNRPFFLIVDEINRGDVPRIFGELLTILERDKRGRAVVLPISGEHFTVPENVYLVGTMNTSDRSIALLDTALRRRFGFVELMPDSSVLGSASVAGIPLGPWLDALNRRIRENLGRDARNLQVGHAYLLEDGKPVSDFPSFARILQDDIIPLLEEYCYEDFERLELILRTGLVDRAAQRIRHELFGPGRQDDLVAVLLTPDVVTSGQAVAAEAEEVAADESPDDVVGDPAP